MKMHNFPGDLSDCSDKKNILGRRRTLAQVALAVTQPTTRAQLLSSAGHHATILLGFVQETWWESQPLSLTRPLQATRSGGSLAGWSTVCSPLVVIASFVVCTRSPGERNPGDYHSAIAPLSLQTERTTSRWKRKSPRVLHSEVLHQWFLFQIIQNAYGVLQPVHFILYNATEQLRGWCHGYSGF